MQTQTKSAYSQKLNTAPNNTPTESSFKHEISVSNISQRSSYRIKSEPVKSSSPPHLAENRGQGIKTHNTEAKYHFWTGYTCCGILCICRYVAIMHLSFIKMFLEASRLCCANRVGNNIHMKFRCYILQFQFIIKLLHKCCKNISITYCY